MTARDRKPSVPASSVALWQTDEQKAGRAVTLGRMLAAAPKFEADADRLDWYLKEPINRIPESWKAKYVFFPEAEFRDAAGDPRVHFLYWSGRRWSCHYCPAGSIVDANCFVAVPASAPCCS